MFEPGWRKRIERETEAKANRGEWRWWRDPLSGEMVPRPRVAVEGEADR